MLLALSVISSQGAALGPTAYKVFDERGGSIGRLDSNDWTLPDVDKFVSTRHAVIRYVNGEFYLEDTSTNGTFINVPDKPVSKEQHARLQDGDRIFIGNYEILVQVIDGGIAAVTPDSVSAPAPRAVEPMPAPPQQTLDLIPNMSGTPQDLLVALGLDPARVDPGLYAQIGTIFRNVVQGLIDVLQSRAEVKSQFRMPMTNIRPVENNPLKFSMNAHDALHNLFVKRNPGYLPAQEAFREGFEDIAFHQIAMLAGVRQAFNAMLASLHPNRLEAAYERKLRRTTRIRWGNRLRYWGMYRAQFEDIEKDADAHFQMLFGEEFAKAYCEQMEKLTSTARRDRR
jgi:predicted component of type VI protein secretion system